jgi:hypothetical protein
MPVMAAAAYNGCQNVINALYTLRADMKSDCAFSMTAVVRANNQTAALPLIENIMIKLTNQCEFCGSSSSK